MKKTWFIGTFCHVSSYNFLFLVMYLKGYDGLGSKFLNRGQNSTKNAEKIAEYFCLERLRELISEKKCKPPRQSSLFGNLAPATPSH